MKNEYGLDAEYFRSKLECVVRDCSRYTPDEMARELTRLAAVAEPKVAAVEAAGDKCRALCEYLATGRMGQANGVTHVQRRARIGYEQALEVIELGRCLGVLVSDPGRKHLHRIVQAPQAPAWLTPEAFKREHGEGWCWIVYKGRVTEAYHSAAGFFMHHPLSRGCYLSESVSRVLPWVEPDMPEELPQ